MGVFLYSNKPIATEAVEEVLVSRGHKDVAKDKTDNYTLVHASKVLVDNENYLGPEKLGSDNPEDFALGVGTYFYDGCYGAKALQKVYDNIEDVLKDNPVYGQWAFCIRKNGTTYIFNDMSGFLRLYSYVDKGCIVVSSSELSVLATIEKPQFDKDRLGGFIAGHYGREGSFVKDLTIVDPLKYLIINEKDEYQWIQWDIPEVERIETLEKAKEYCKKLFQQQIDAIKPALQDKKVFMDATGGLDSRLASSVLKTAGIDFDYLNYPIFGPDAEIAKILSEGLKKPLHIQTNISIANDIEKHFGEFDYGNNYFRQYPNPRWIKENDFEFSGARGECIDLPDIYSDEDLSYMKDTRPEVLLSKLTPDPLMTETNQKAYIRCWMDYLKDRCGFEEGKPLDEKQQAEFAQFVGGQYGDSMYCSGAQAHIYFYQMYNEWHFNHFITDIAFEAKQCRRLTLALIQDIDPELGSYPFVSRRRTKRNSVNETTELPMKYHGYNGIKKLLPKPVLNYLYKKIGREFSKTRLNQIQMDEYKDVLNVVELKRYPNLYSDILNRMYSVEVIRKKYGIQ